MFTFQLTKMTSSALVLLHVVSVAMFSYTLYYASFVMDVPFLRKMFSEFDPGQLKYLTMWDVVRKALFHFINFSLLFFNFQFFITFFTLLINLFGKINNRSKQKTNAFNEITVMKRKQRQTLRMKA